MNRRDFLLGAAGLALAPDALAARLGGVAVALVTADLDSSVVAIELSRGRRFKTIRTLSDPRSIEAVGGAAVVAHTARGALTVIDAAWLEVTHVIDGLGAPRYTAAARDRRHAYVTDSELEALLVVDVARGRIVRRLALGGPARHVSAELGGWFLWAALGNKAERIAVVDVRQPTRPRLVGRMRPAFLAHDVGFAPGGDRVWVTSGDRREVAIYDRRTARTVVRLGAGAPPQHVTFSARRAFVTSGADGTITVHAAADGRLLGRADVPDGSYNVQEGSGAILTPSLSRGTLCVLDQRGREVRTTRVARSSHDACFVMAA